MQSMTATIRRGTARGRLTAPPSKSMAHRLLLCAGLSRGRSVIRNVSYSQDILATLDCLSALGAVCRAEAAQVTVSGANPFDLPAPVCADCRESGSTLRFLLPVFLLSGQTVTLRGEGRLLQRPQEIYRQLCQERGLPFAQTQREITLRGPLAGGDFRLAGDVSSQFISGLLFALPLLAADSRITLLPPVESRSYLDMTLQAMAMFGVHAEFTGDYTLSVPGGQRYRATDATVEGDDSNAAFWLALQALGGSVQVDGLRADSLQGDRVSAALFQQLSAGRPVDIGNCPDLGPVLMAVAAAKNGGVLTGTRRLQLKESDRGRAMAQELQKMGVSCIVAENRITVSGGLTPPREALFGHNDHRIVMALAVLLTLTGGTILGAQAVSKSYPDFFDRLRELGIEVDCHET